MCKIYDAIHDVSKMAETDKLTVWVDSVEIHGTFVCCDKENGCKCLEDVLTIKDACVHCGGEKKHYKWLNIPTHGIKGFTFGCCCK